MSWNTVPVVDFSACRMDLNGTDMESSKLKQTAGEIIKAFEEVGFVYLKNHGIPQDMIERMFHLNSTFFALPLDKKLKYERGDDLDNHGYCPLERERTNASRPADYKECYDVDLLSVKEHRWPGEKLVPDFKKTFLDFYHNCEKLWLRLLQIVGIGLQLQDIDYFVKRHDPKRKSHCVLRVINYPAIECETDLKTNQLRCGEHTDYGSLTFLFQDDHGGLQVWNKSTNDYTDAPPVSNTMIVNIGDLMQRWTGDRLISTKHRVVNSGLRKAQKAARMSLIMFVHPNDDCVVECIDGTNKYPLITAEEYLSQRYASTFGN